jgi:hypothetical protein
MAFLYDIDDSTGVDDCAWIAPGLSRFCDTREDFRDTAMTDASQWFRVFCRLLEDFRRRGGKVAGGGGSATPAYPV